MTPRESNLRRPTRAEIRSLADEFHMDLRDEEVEYVEAMLTPALSALDELDGLPEPRRERRFAERDDGYRPSADEDPHNAIVRRCRVDGAAEGPLSGYDVSLKDNVPVAGIETTYGTTMLGTYVPDRDATVVTRLLEAGATITAKTNLSSLTFSGATGEITATGPVLNPHDGSHVAGGSSSGAAVSVVTGDSDLAIGTDQGGSIRIPASWSGCVGLKPTFGLVPYTGIQSLEPTVDHAGPMARTVADCANALDALAGPDPLDPRQDGSEPREYGSALRKGIDGLTVGVLEEGFDVDGADPAVLEAVRGAIDRVADAATDVTAVSVPWHVHGTAIRAGIMYEGATATIRNEGVGRFAKGYYDRQFAEAFGAARRVRADDFPPFLKFTLVLGEYLAERYQGRFHAKAQNRRRELTGAYDEALSEVDLLAMPTTVGVAPEIAVEGTLAESISRTFDAVSNTAPFNLTGHPAISVPCGSVDGLPVGLMLVGNAFRDDVVLRGAHSVVEQVET